MSASVFARQVSVQHVEPHANPCKHDRMWTETVSGKRSGKVKPEGQELLTASVVVLHELNHSSPRGVVASRSADAQRSSSVLHEYLQENVEGLELHRFLQFLHRLCTTFVESARVFIANSLSWFWFSFTCWFVSASRQLKRPKHVRFPPASTNYVNPSIPKDQMKNFSIILFLKFSFPLRSHPCKILEPWMVSSPFRKLPFSLKRPHANCVRKHDWFPS